MSEFNAAQEQDEIAHTASEGWLIAGACTGGGLGELMGSMSWAPRHSGDMATKSWSLWGS